MTVASVTGALARVQEIRQRIAGAAPADFASALAHAGGPAGVPRSRSTWSANPFGQPSDDVWTQALPPEGRKIAGTISAVAQRHGLDPRLLASLVWAESGFHQESVSSAGAVGLTQLMPGTAAGLGVDPHDPMQNLEGGARYLRAQIDRFGSVDLALAAYNAGPGRVLQAGGVPAIPETRNYVVRVLDYYQQLGGAV